MSALLVLAESAWLALLVDVLADGTAGPARPAVDLPFLAFALPALLAVVLASWGGRRLLLARLLAAAALAVVTAELVASLTPGVPVFASLAGPVAGRAILWASIVAVLAWGRGSWLGFAPPSVAHATVSVLFGTVVIVVVLAHRAAAHTPAFGRATADAWWLLVVFFLAGFAAVASAHVRSVEHAATRGAASGPGGAWVAAMSVPLVAVVLVALLLGGGGTVVGPAAASLARAIGGAVTSAGTWLFAHLFGSLHPSAHAASATLHLHGGAAGRGSRTRSSPPAFVRVLVVAVVAVLGIGVLAVLARISYLIVRRLRRGRSPEAAREQRSSVFSWAHLLAQLRAVLARIRLPTRARQPAAAERPATMEPAVETAALDPVRAAYRRFLVAVRAATLGRHPIETARELAGRLDLDGPALDSLTGVYERVRYGGTDSEGGVAMADAAADALTTELVEGTALPGAS